MASATPVASGRGQSTSAPEDKGVRGLRCPAEWPHVADAVIEARNWLSRYMEKFRTLDDISFVNDHLQAHVKTRVK